MEVERGFLHGLGQLREGGVLDGLGQVHDVGVRDLVGQGDFLGVFIEGVGQEIVVVALLRHGRGSPRVSRVGG